MVVLLLCLYLASRHPEIRNERRERRYMVWNSKTGRPTEATPPPPPSSLSQITFEARFCQAADLTILECNPFLPLLLLLLNFLFCFFFLVVIL